MHVKNDDLSQADEDRMCASQRFQEAELVLYAALPPLERSSPDAAEQLRGIIARLSRLESVVRVRTQTLCDVS